VHQSLDKSINRGITAGTERNRDNQNDHEAGCPYERFDRTDYCENAVRERHLVGDGTATPFPSILEEREGAKTFSHFHTGARTDLIQRQTWFLICSKQSKFISLRSKYGGLNPARMYP
jgi:hypothetical protein